MEKRTNIQIEHSTLIKLREMKAEKRETYDHLINMLINNYYKK